MTLPLSPPDLCLPDFAAQHARLGGQRPALLEGDRVLSWAAFGQAVDAAACSLADAGLAAGGSVALLSRPCIEAVVWQFAVLRAGGVVASISAAVSDEAVGRMIADAGAALVLADATAAARLAQGAGGAFTLLRADQPPPAAAPRPLPTLSGEGAMNIIYSSGTTGSPKGIVLTHRSRLDYALIMSAALGVGPDSVVMVTTALCSNMSWTLLLCALAQGASTVLMDRFDAEAFCRLADRHGATHTIMAPVQFQRILDHPACAGARLDSFKAICSVGSAMSPAAKARAASRFPGAFHEVYGMTEGFATLLRPRDLATRASSVGRPLPGNDVRIIGADDAEAPPGESGEIVARSPMLMRGYHNQPALTAAALWADPAGGGHFLRSGDVGRIDADGFVHLLDRKKDMIISGGQNIYPADLERVLADHPQVSEAVVIGVPDPVWGETPLALVVPGAQASISPEELRQWANDRLGRHQRLTALEFRDILARNDGGKVVKAQLRAPYWKSS